MLTLSPGIAMTRNVGRTDQVLRIVVGLGLIALAFVGPQTRLGYFGLIPLFTGLLGTCPLYSLLGMSTRERSTDHTARI